MASTKRYYTRIPNGGIDRTAQPHASSPDGFYDLLNLRPEVGALRQTSPVVSKVTLSTLASETNSTVRFVDLARTAAATLRYLVLNEQTARYITPTSLATQTLIPAVTQTKVPNNATVFGQALLYGFNTTDFSVSGDYIEVKIVSTTQFQWNRNGGGWSGSLTVDRSVPIGANGLLVDFFETTGYTTNDLWRWTRTETLPYSSSIASTKNFTYSSAAYLTDVYLGGIGRNIMRVRDGLITGVGYKRVYGKHVAIFQNHLVVTHFAEGQYHAVDGVSDPFAAATTPFVVGWSDLNNPDNFFATDINESDTYSVPYNSYPESVNYGLTGLGLLNNTLWLYTTDGMSSMDYVGLPNVMQILPRHTVGSLYPNGLVVAKSGHYFIGRDNIYFFDGVKPKEIGDPVFKQFYDEVLPLDPASDDSESVIGYYDLFRQEVSWTYWTSAAQCKQLVYSEKFNRWFFRNLPYETANKTRAIGRVYGSSTRLLYGGVQKINFDYDSTESTSAILLDDQASAGYTQPLAVTNDVFYNDLYVQKSADCFYLDAGWDSGVTGLELSHSIRSFVSTAVSFVVLAVLWTQSVWEGRLSLPRKNGRVFRFKFRFTGSKPVGCVLNAWGDQVYGEGRGLQH
jgi:hypothetical protein